MEKLYWCTQCKKDKLKVNFFRYGKKEPFLETSYCDDKKCIERFRLELERLFESGFISKKEKERGLYESRLVEERLKKQQS